MPLSNSEIISIILIAATILYLLILLIVAQNKYSDFLAQVKKTKADFKEDLGGFWVTKKGGDWVVGDYWFRSPLPIAFKTKDPTLKKLVDAHDKIIRLFWISAIVLLPSVIIVLHLINS